MKFSPKSVDIYIDMGTFEKLGNHVAAWSRIRQGIHLEKSAARPTRRQRAKGLLRQIRAGEAQSFACTRAMVLNVMPKKEARTSQICTQKPPIEDFQVAYGLLGQLRINSGRVIRLADSFSWLRGLFPQLYPAFVNQPSPKGLRQATPRGIRQNIEGFIFFMGVTNPSEQLLTGMLEHNPHSSLLDKLDFVAAAKYYGWQDKDIVRYLQTFGANYNITASTNGVKNRHSIILRHPQTGRIERKHSILENPYQDHFQPTMPTEKLDLPSDYANRVLT